MAGTITAGAGRGRLGISKRTYATAVVLWGWLAWEFRSKALYAFVSILLTGIGFSLVYLGYHYPVDIAGAVVFGMVTLLIYGLVLSLTQKHHASLIGLGLLPLTLAMTYLLPRSFTHVWLAQGAVLGFSLGWLTYHHLGATYERKTLKILLAFLGTALLYLGFQYLSTPSIIMTFVQFLIIAYWNSFLAPYAIDTRPKVGPMRH